METIAQVLLFMAGIYAITGGYMILLFLLKMINPEFRKKYYEIKNVLNNFNRTGNLDLLMNININYPIKKITTIRNLKIRNSHHIFENNNKFNKIWDCFVGTKIITSRLYDKL